MSLNFKVPGLSAAGSGRWTSLRAAGATPASAHDRLVSLNPVLVS